MSSTEAPSRAWDVLSAVTTFAITTVLFAGMLWVLDLLVAGDMMYWLAVPVGVWCTGVVLWQQDFRPITKGWVEE